MKDKSIIAAIASLRADLDKLEARVKEEELAVGKEFAPGWEIVERVYNRNGNIKRDILTIRRETYEREVLSPKTRYNWPLIVKKYPSAQWASTDGDGRIDAWKECPKINEVAGGWVNGKQSGYYVTISPGRSTDWHHVSDWRDSLEKRPDYL